MATVLTTTSEHLNARRYQGHGAARRAVNRAKRVLAARSEVKSVYAVELQNYDGATQSGRSGSGLHIVAIDLIPPFVRPRKVTCYLKAWK